MTSFRASAPLSALVGIGIGCGLAMAASAPASAQQPPPRTLTPPQAAPVQVPRPAAPVSLAPPSVDPTPSATPSDNEATRGGAGSGRAPGIQVDRLRELNPDSVGLIGPDQGGLSPDMWQETPRPVIEKLLSLLPKTQTSPAARSLTERLLLSRAIVPGGRNSLLALRAKRLLAMGYTGPALELLTLAPPGVLDEDLSQRAAEALFLVDDPDGACKLVANASSRYVTPYWRQANAFCLAVGGDTARSAMVADILRERGGDVSPGFFALMEALDGGATPSLESADGPPGLMMAMVRAAGAAPPRSMLDRDNPALARAIALDPKADIETRLIAAERALELGTLSAPQLVGLYGDVPFSEEDISAPISRADATWDASSRALLMQAAKRRDQPTARAELLRTALQFARQRGNYLTMARALEPMLVGLAATPGLSWFAEDAGRALFAAGRPNAALAWVEIAARGRGLDPTAGAAFDRLWPLAQLAQADNRFEWEPDRIVRWQEDAARRAEQDGPETDGAPVAARVIGLLDALEKPIPPGLWSQLVGEDANTPVPMPAFALWQALDSAAGELRVGETIALALVMLGADGASVASPYALQRAVMALHTLGLDSDARALALEAAIAAGA